MKLGELISLSRELKGWSLRDLEKACGVSNPLLSQIETGKVKDPGFSTVVRICDALGIKIERAAKTARPPHQEAGRRNPQDWPQQDLR